MSTVLPHTTPAFEHTHTRARTHNHTRAWMHTHARELANSSTRVREGIPTLPRTNKLTGST